MNHKGFSLIELLIAIAIFGILLTALTAFFISQNRQYVVQSQIVEMQDNARAAMDFTVRMLRNSIAISLPSSGNNYGDGSNDGCDHKIEFASFVGLLFVVTDISDVEEISNKLDEEEISNELKIKLDVVDEDIYNNMDSITPWNHDSWLIISDDYQIIIKNINDSLYTYNVKYHSLERDPSFTGIGKDNAFLYRFPEKSSSRQSYALNITCFEVEESGDDDNQFKVVIKAKTERKLPGTGDFGTITLQSTVKPRNLN